MADIEVLVLKIVLTMWISKIPMIDASLFFFDRFLGRLCYGSSYETGEDATFLRRGSRIEQEADLLIEYLATKFPQYEELLENIRHAKL